MFSRDKLRAHLPPGVYGQIEEQLDDIQKESDKRMVWRVLNKLAVMNEADVVNEVNLYFNPPE